MLAALCHATAAVAPDVAVQEVPTALPLLVAGLPELLRGPGADDCAAIVAVLDLLRTSIQQPAGGWGVLGVATVYHVLMI